MYEYVSLCACMHACVCMKAWRHVRSPWLTFFFLGIEEREERALKILLILWMIFARLLIVIERIYILYVYTYFITIITIMITVYLHPLVENERETDTLRAYIYVYLYIGPFSPHFFLFPSFFFPRSFNFLPSPFFFFFFFILEMYFLLALDFVPLFLYEDPAVDDETCRRFYLHIYTYTYIEYYYIIVVVRLRLSFNPSFWYSLLLLFLYDIWLYTGAPRASKIIYKYILLYYIYNIYFC